MDNDNDVLEPGYYSVFALDDGGTWEQPTYRISRRMKVGTFKDKVLKRLSHNVFALFGLDEDPDCPTDSAELLR
jgi:hypothetical protein